MAQYQIGGGGYLNQTADRQSLGGVYIIDTTTGDTIAALTGNAATASAGSLGIAFSKALSGHAATASQGSFLFQTFVSWAEIELPSGTLSASAGLTGIPAYMFAGVLGPTIPDATRAFLSWAEIELPVSGTGNTSQRALTGNAAAGAYGSFGPAFSKSLVGHLLTMSGGTLVPFEGVTIALTGAAITSAVGTLVHGHGADLTGLSATASAGTPNISTTETYALAGVFGVAFGVPLSGGAMTTAIGILTADIDGNATLELVGVSGSTAAGYFMGTAALSGLSMTASAGTLVSDETLAALTGYAATASAGSFNSWFPLPDVSDATWTAVPDASTTWQ